MANLKQLNMLKEGSKLWNLWRKDNREINPDLIGADLTEANMSFVDLMGANLTGANLAQADFRRANLNRANLTDANLTRANLNRADLSDASLTRSNLSRANLSMTKFKYANLRDADLKETRLIWTDFSYANLNGADLSNATLAYTIFGDTDLATTKGLDSCQFGNSSIIDFQTLQSFKSLPLRFLRGCGLPDHYIEYLPSLINQPIQYYSCFISYSNENKEFTERLYADLQNNGVRCWYAPEDMKIGDKFRTRIDEVIHIHEKLLLVLSDQSINSDWVEKEVETAFEKERKNKDTVLFPIRLDNAVLDCDTGWAADIKKSRHIGDFQNWKDHDDYQKALDRLLRDLKTAPE